MSVTDTNLLSGATRLFCIAGDPIAQVKSPAALTGALGAAGQDAVLVAVHVGSQNFAGVMDGLRLIENLDGVVATVPHKFAAYTCCATATKRAHFLRAANVLRRNPNGSWHGDMTDGVGFVAAAGAVGCHLEGRRALLVGAGGAGSAIALALLDAGVAELAIHDEATDRRDGLLARLRERSEAVVRRGSPDPTGYMIVVNATPLGMREDDPYPVRIDKLSSEMFVGDVITVPVVTPLLAAARRLGCRTQTGVGMYNAQLNLMRDFLLNQ